MPGVDAGETEEAGGPSREFDIGNTGCDVLSLDEGVEGVLFFEGEAFHLALRFRGEGELSHDLLSTDLVDMGGVVLRMKTVKIAGVAEHGGVRSHTQDAEENQRPADDEDRGESIV